MWKRDDRATWYAERRQAMQVFSPHRRFTLGRSRGIREVLGPAPGPGPSFILGEVVSMSKKALLAVLVLLVVWSALDLVIHNVLLAEQYAAQPELWRPQAEMKMGLMYLVTLITALAFVAVYAKFFKEKGPGPGLRYGLWFGLGTGASMAYGSYSVMPIPYTMALTWFVGTMVQTGIAGWIVGSMVRE